MRCEWLIERPATACLPQKSQTFDITTSKEARDIAHQFTCAVTMYHIKRSLQSQKGRIWWFGVRSALTALQNITLTLWPESSLRPRPRPHTSYARPHARLTRSRANHRTNARMPASRAVARTTARTLACPPAKHHELGLLINLLRKHFLSLVCATITTIPTSIRLISERIRFYGTRCSRNA